MPNILKSAWALLREGSRDDAQVALAVAALTLVSGWGLLVAFAYGCFARDAQGCGFLCHAAGGGLAVLSGTGAFFAGGVLGLLFGAPRWGDGGAAAPSAAREGDTSGSAPAQTGSATVRPNTSLERVADWLTTIIVGLGLVHLKDLEGRVTDMGMWLTNAITLHADGKNGTPGVVLALSFGVAGFLLVYLWSLRFLPSELEGAYAAIKRLKQQTEDLSKKIERFKTDPIYAMSPEDQAAMRTRLADNGTDEETIAEALKRYVAATRWIDDPMKDFGSTESDGFRLSVTLKDLQPGIWMFTAIVESASFAEQDKVTFLLHNSFIPNACVDGTRTDRGFVYEGQTNGAFCLGAVVPRPGQPAVRLSLDMRDLPGVPDTFRNG